MNKNKNKFKKVNLQEIDDIENKINYIKIYRSPELIIEDYFIGLNKYLHKNYCDCFLYKKSLHNHDNCLLFIYNYKKKMLDIRYDKIYLFLIKYSKYNIEKNDYVFSIEYTNFLNLIRKNAKKYLNIDVQTICWWIFNDVKGGIKLEK